MQRTLPCVRIGGLCRRLLPVSVLLSVLALPAGAQKPPTERADTPPAQSPPAKAASLGTFTDRSGTAHKWQITTSHALIWDGAPFLPVGGAFTPRSFAADTEASGH